VFTVTSRGVGDPATVVTDVPGETDSHGAELAVFTVRIVAALEVTLITWFAPPPPAGTLEKISCCLSTVRVATPLCARVAS